MKPCCRSLCPWPRPIYTTLTGFSPLMAEELCCRASLDGGLPTDACDEPSRLHLYHTFARMMEDVREGNFSPVHRIPGPGAL